MGVDDDILKGFWLGTQLTPEWRIEFEVRRTQTHLVELAGGVAPREPSLAKFVPSSIEIGGARVFPRGNFVPYVAFGVGLENVEVDTEDAAVRDVNRFGLSAAFGARYYAAPWVGARIDVRARAIYLGRRGFGEDRGWSDTGRWLRDGELLAGVFFSFGGRAP